MRKIAGGQSVNGLEWLVEFEEEGKGYSWSGRFEASPKNEDYFPFGQHPEYAVMEEKLVLSDGKTVFSRDGEELVYCDKPTVKLDKSKSAVELLKEEDLVAPVNRAFKRIGLLNMEPETAIRIRPAYFDAAEAKMSIKEIKRARLSQIEKMFLIQKNGLPEFKAIKEAFTDIFPLVEDMDFDLVNVFKDRTVPMLQIKEKGVDAWIRQHDVSSGMMRTLCQIVTLTLADDGDVILVDEFENGLGINCIDRLAEMAMEPEADVQIIMTSHHPYIINTIPFRNWRIVSRKGSDVSVHTAEEFRIGSHSRHDAFMQLLQTSAYKTGQA